MSAKSPAPISPGSMSALECLAVAADKLLVDLRAAAGHSSERTPPTSRDAADDVARYLALVAESVSTNDAALALRGATLLTTVNNGVSDLAASLTDRSLGEKAFNVTRRDRRGRVAPCGRRKRS